MIEEVRRAMLMFLPALVQPPPDTTQYLDFLASYLASIIRLPPDLMLDIRHRLFAIDEDAYNGRNVFAMFADQRFHFFEITGETLETFLQLVAFLRVSAHRRHTLSVRNTVLLVMIWLRSYLPYVMLSTLFDVSISTVKDEIRTLLPVMYLKMKTLIS